MSGRIYIEGAELGKRYESPELAIIETLNFTEIMREELEANREENTPEGERRKGA